MNMSVEFQQVFEQALKLRAEGDFAAAEKALKSLVVSRENREGVLRALVELYMQAQRPIETVETLKELVAQFPDSLLYCASLASALEGLGKLGTAIIVYQEFLQGQPANPTAWFNVALLYKKGKRYSDAVQAYEQAIAHKVDRIEEVYSNMGVLYSEMRQADKARAMYKRALEINPDYVQALFNFAGLCEEAGQGEEATGLYERILSLDPRHLESRSRLVYARKIRRSDMQMIDSLMRASEEANNDLLGKESILFALGKAFDDLEQYGDAFAAYSQANEIGKLRNLAYKRNAVEQAFDDLIEVFSPEKLSGLAIDSPNVAPVFICGMFRSGSTLVEQILSGHPLITAGGELDYLQWLVAQKLSPFPDRAVTASSVELQALGGKYLSMVQTLFPNAQCITDKQPDNFLYLGLIKILYPSAKIIYTSRNPLDNCLSVNFQQLGGRLNYATDLKDTAHYYKQHKRLMNHWINCFPENIFKVDYDELVSSPEPLLRRLLDFLDLDWDEGCLAFQESANPVKTASVWQVREGLHTDSSGRWRNYASFVKDIQTFLN
ncbi:MAG: tetratricopeptide (TPR) repeat protein [Planctomycetota bacterium]|jgi:tetratricopeptide (TPR) repeat protein